MAVAASFANEGQWRGPRRAAASAAACGRFPRHPHAHRDARAFVKPTAAEVREAKQALLAAMKAHPAAGTHELARLTGSRPPTVAERLRRLKGRGLIARDAGGKRRAVEARPT
jgi:hypothetical protein